jgi:hypothetical protein
MHPVGPCIGRCIGVCARRNAQGPRPALGLAVCGALRSGAELSGYGPYWSDSASRAASEPQTSGSVSGLRQSVPLASRRLHTRAHAGGVYPPCAFVMWSGCCKHRRRNPTCGNRSAASSPPSAASPPSASRSSASRRDRAGTRVPEAIREPDRHSLSQERRAAPVRDVRARQGRAASP